MQPAGRQWVPIEDPSPDCNEKQKGHPEQGPQSAKARRTFKVRVLPGSIHHGQTAEIPTGQRQQCDAQSVHIIIGKEDDQGPTIRHKVAEEEERNEQDAEQDRNPDVLRTRLHKQEAH
jgi:hypothetical protein